MELICGVWVEEIGEIEGNKINTLTFLLWEEQKNVAQESFFFFYDKSYICLTFPSAILQDKKTSKQKKKFKYKQERKKNYEELKRVLPRILFGMANMLSFVAEKKNTKIFLQTWI